ncbi:MAG: head-tail adaptor protein [Flavobacteriaceae bacterium]|jgi:head-tail adaptor|nr:head-tail adaptor protein [Flavobacteriaceae bacterium]
MNAGKLDKRVLIKRQTKSSDGFGGYTSTNATQSTIWAKVDFTNGEITSKNGRKKRNLQIELLVRKKTADTILTTDLLQIENISGLYQINDMYDADYKYYTKLIATKRD